MILYTLPTQQKPTLILQLKKFLKDSSNFHPHEG